MLLWSLFSGLFQGSSFILLISSLMMVQRLIVTSLFVHDLPQKKIKKINLFRRKTMFIPRNSTVTSRTLYLNLSEFVGLGNPSAAMQVGYLVIIIIVIPLHPTHTQSNNQTNKTILDVAAYTEL